MNNNYDQPPYVAGRNVCGVIRKHHVIVTPAVYRARVHAFCDERAASTWLARGARKNTRKTVTYVCATRMSTRHLADAQLAKPVLPRADAFHFRRNGKACGQSNPGQPVMHAEDGYDDNFMDLMTTTATVRSDDGTRK